ncbi:MAG: MBL fold metallo-hydrolase [Gemmatimonadetes bacterium]|nr:MBL fold metallo-hydrolase [Gemmatimonadota bacterium]
MPASVSVVNVGYRSTNFWVVSAGRSRLLIDLGWPGMFGALESNLRRMDVPLAEISHGLATHYHIDHAGAAQDLKNRGMRLVVTPEQLAAIPAMKAHLKPADRYTDIRLDDNLVVPCHESRAFLARLGFAGEIVPTPGHSDDSVSVVLDSGEAFTGDLTVPAMIADDAGGTLARDSWRRLAAMGVRTIYGGHAGPWPLVLS